MDLVRLVSMSGQPVASFLAESWAAYRGASQWSDVPPLEPSLRLVAESMMDQTFGVVVSLVTGVPAPEQVRRAQQDVRSMHEFLDAHGWLQSPLGYHRRPSTPDSWELRDATSWLGNGIRWLRYRHLELDSGYAPHHDEPGRDEWLAKSHNHRLHAWVLEHPGPPRPWLVCVHGFGMGTPLVNFRGFDVGRLHTELGLNLIMPCLPLHGARSATRMSGGELLQPDYLAVIHLFAQSIWDIRRTIAWVRNRGAPKMGLYGISLGGYNVAIASALEPDLDCVVAGIPAVDFPSLARDNEPWVFRRYSNEFEVDWDTVRSISHVVSPLAFTPAVPVERRFIYAGTADRVVRPVHARALWRHWDRPKIHWFSGGHVLGVMNTGARDFVAEALRESGMTSAS